MLDKFASPNECASGMEDAILRLDQYIALLRCVAVCVGQQEGGNEHALAIERLADDLASVSNDLDSRRTYLRYTLSCIPINHFGGQARERSAMTYRQAEEGH